MTVMRYGQAVDYALGEAMAADDRVLTWGEDVELVHRDLLARFGPDRVRDTPISEAAFLYAGVGAAMSGLRPVVEIMMVDFLTVAWSALVNGASKFRDFSGGRWQVPLVNREAVRRATDPRIPVLAKLSPDVTDIVEATGKPVALHGGTGMTPEQFADLIGRGCAKVNISTALKIAYMKSGYDFMTEHPGDYDPPKIFTAQRAAVMEMARYHIRLFGSEGKAWT